MMKQDAKGERSSNALLNVLAAATHLGVSVSAMNKWRLAGNGPRYVKLGRAVRYRLATLDQWIDENTRRSTSEAAE